MEGAPMKNKTRFITRTALLLAVAIAFQLLGRILGPYNNFIVGPVVNAVLIIATAIAGFWSGAAIAVIAPLVSAFTNKAAIAPLILAFSPFIILGNVIIVAAFHFLKKKSKIAAIAAGALLKFGFLYAAISIFTAVMKMQPKVAATLTNLFSWPQLLTAAIGGVVALAVLAALEKSLEMEDRNG
jgi:hypothetical protein